MANDPNDRFNDNDPSQKPRLSDGREHLGEEFVRPVPRENRGLGDEFTDRNTYDGKHLGQEFADTSYGGDREMGRAFADPNSLDDTAPRQGLREDEFQRKEASPSRRTSGQRAVYEAQEQEGFVDRHRRYRAGLPAGALSSAGFRGTTATRRLKR